MIEVIKGISAVGLFGVFKELWNCLVHNKDMSATTPPVLNFVVAMLFCWAFDMSIMKQLFSSMLGTRIHEPIASWLDYFGTASVMYVGAGQFFKRVIDVEKVVTSTVTEVKKDQETLGVQQVKGQNTTTTTTSVTGKADENVPDTKVVTEKVVDSVDTKKG
jgi:hypothetical protein